MRAAGETPVLYEGREHRPGLSIGIARAGAESVEAAAAVGGARQVHGLLRAADAAMYEAKRGGRRRWVFAGDHAGAAA